MKIRNLITLAITLCTLPLSAKELPNTISSIMNQPRYQHALWGLYVKNLDTGEILHDLNSQKMFLPASTTKLFSVSSLLAAYGDSYRFKTPLYAVGEVNNGHFTGQLVLVGQGDLVFGGRDLGDDRIEFTNRDHIIANAIPEVELTKADPLKGIESLARQIKQKGINIIDGDVQIDDSLFESVSKREMTLSPIMLNENMIDITLKPTKIGESVNLQWRPHVEGFTIKNEVTSGSNLNIEISSDESGQHIVVKGTIPTDQGNIIRTFSVKDPEQFVRLALIQAIREQGITFNIEKGAKVRSYPAEPIAVHTSAPLSEYAKLILKVSHNLGADLVPLLLAAKNHEKTFDQGMLLMGRYVTDQLKVPANSFVFLDAAGGDENRVTPSSEVVLLEKQSHNQVFSDALPILGVDGSLADFAQGTAAAGNVRAKTGTGVTFNLANGKLFSTTHTLAGYVAGKNGKKLAFMVGVNNVESPTIDSILEVAKDLALISAELYTES